MSQVYQKTVFAPQFETVQ